MAMASGQGPQTWTAGTGASLRSSPVSGGAVNRQRVIISMTGMGEDVSACGEPKELTIPKRNVPTPSPASAMSPIRSLGQTTHGQLPSPAGVRGQPCWCRRSALPVSEVSCAKLAFQLPHQTALNGHVGLSTGKVSPSQGTSGYCFGGEERGGGRVVTETPTDSLCPTQRLRTPWAQDPIPRPHRSQ